MMLGRSLWLIWHARLDGHRVGERSDIGRVIVLVRGILVRGGCEGFVGNLAMCELWLRHGHLPPFS